MAGHAHQHVIDSVPTPVRPGERSGNACPTDRSIRKRMDLGTAGARWGSVPADGLDSGVGREEGQKGYALSTRDPLLASLVGPTVAGFTAAWRRHCGVGSV